MRRIPVVLLWTVGALTVAWAEPLPLSTLPLSTQQIATLRAVQQEDIAHAEPQLTWRGDPLRIALPIGQEKRLIFSEPVEVDVNGKLTTDQLRIINNDKNVYLTAQTAFPKTRIYVTLKNTQQIILLDLWTDGSSNAATQKIVVSDKKGAPLVAEGNPQNPLADSAQAESMLSADAYVDTLRFAWQQLYTPQRLLNGESGFTRTPMHSAFWVPELVYGDKVFVHPEASWQRGGWYVTAVALRNKYPHAASINLARDVCGDWQAAVLYPRHALKPVGEKEGDTTTLFLLSNKPFGQAMEVCRGGA
jgi:integrating conjugative element protein (TIGR03749 family)